MLAEALELPPTERAALADELEASLEGSVDDVQRAWAEELEHRAREVIEGRSRGRGAREVLAEIRGELAAPKR